MNTEIQLISEIKCPVCKEYRKPEETIQVFNENNGGDETLIGYAVITICCAAIVAKSYWFDYNRALFGNGTGALKKMGYTLLNGVAIPAKPEVLTRKMRKKSKKPVQDDEIALYQERYS